MLLRRAQYVLIYSHALVVISNSLEILCLPRRTKYQERSEQSFSNYHIIYGVLIITKWGCGAIGSACDSSSQGYLVETGQPHLFLSVFMIEEITHH